MRKSSQKKTKLTRKSSKKPTRPVKKTARKLRRQIVRKSLKKIKIQKFIPPAAEISERTVPNSAPAPSGFEFPERYGDNKLVLMVRDPWWIYAYWETTFEKEREILGHVERQNLTSPRKVLRIYDVTDKNPPDHHSFFDIEIGFAGNWYVDVGRPDRQWLAEIGFRTREGRFFALVRSNVVRTPRFGVSDILDEEWLLPDELYWKIFGLSGGIGGRKSSLDVKEILERYLRGLGASENSPNLSPGSASKKRKLVCHSRPSRPYKKLKTLFMEKGYLSIVLHAHLPYVRHPEHQRFLEEEWFYEAITETYIPLIKAFSNLVRDGVDFRITMSLTPTLLSMMTDPFLQDRYVRHLERLIELSRREIERTQHEPAFRSLAEMYHGFFIEAREIFCDRYHKNLAQAFKEFQDLGKLEIITCGATHGFLPLMEIHREAVRAQIRVAAETHEKILGRRPRGIWLPECGYYPGLDEILKEEGIRFFIVDTHGILFGSPRPKYGVFAPVYCRSGVAAFGRDMESSKSVWSAEEGYPGDYQYREFYRDIGFDLNYDYIKPYLNGDGSRINTGIKYYRITGPGNHKEPYSPEAARQKAAEHASNFMFNREKQAEHLEGLMGQKPLVVSPYDAELYGHWWFEGPLWLEFLFRKIHFDQNTIKTITPTEYIEGHPRNQVIAPSMSSWGYNGYAEVWLNGANDWIYRHLHKASERMIILAKQHANAENIERRFLNQMARELLLAQSSDWAFIMKTGTHTSYAVKRTKDHLERFTNLWSQITKKNMDIGYLESIESTDNIFPWIDYRVYAS